MKETATALATHAVRARLQIEAKPPPYGKGTPSEGLSSCLDFLSSDATVDRFSEVIDPAGWKLDTYRQNPVFQNAHQYGDIIFTLGRALITEVREAAGRQALYQRIQFAVDANPLARVAFGLYSGKFLSAVSVGFHPIAWQEGTAGTPFRRRYLEQELLEVSAVAIPANPNALALALKSGALEKTDLQDTADLIRDTLCASPGCGRGCVAVSDSSKNEDQNWEILMALARQIRSQLKHL